MCNNKPFRYCVQQGAAFTPEELHSALLESFHKWGPNNDSFRYCVQRVADVDSAIRLAILVDSAQTFGPRSMIAQALLHLFDRENLPLLVKYLISANKQGESWESLYSYIKQRSPVFVIERVGKTSIVCSEAFFQAQSSTFARWISTRMEKRYVDKVDFPVDDLDLKVIADQMTEQNQPIPVFQMLDEFDDTILDLLLKCCQNLSVDCVDWELLQIHPGEWLQDMMKILTAADYFGIFLLKEKVQVKLHLELTAAPVDREVVNYIKENMPYDAKILNQWCSEQ